jgi:adenine-specific DNA-methyltransferase
MQESAFLNHRFEKQEFDSSKSMFDELSLPDQKAILIEALDHNLLYAPYSGIEDSDFGFSQEEKDLNKMFYSKI